MAIQWYPGHMHSTKKALVERLPDIDVVIELLDARLPGASANPLLAELTRDKPSLKVLTKQDLADPEITALWLAHLQSPPPTDLAADGAADPGAAAPPTQALALDASMAAPVRPLVAACRALAPRRGGLVKPLRVLVCGIPNVGKSTLINSLVGQRSAKTGDEPGITKQEQRISLASDVYLFDTPGMLWPRINVARSGYNLAASGGIGRNAYDEEEVALELQETVRLRYADRLRARYGLDDIGALSSDALLADIGRRRGGLMAGGRVNLQKAGEIVLNDFRSGAWGRITLETPEDHVRWLAEGQALEAERLAQKAQRNKRQPKRKAGAAPGGPDEPA